MSHLPDHDPRTTERGSAPTIALTIDGRTRDLGDGMSVKRLLPSVARRMVGPFIFVDHMGPARFVMGHGMDVRPHPHINLATVTYLFEGEVLHRDSIGSEQIIRPGAVNWMTAGRGIAHSERTPAEARASASQLHGMQLWVALPTADEEVEPSFQHHAATSIPEIDVDGARIRVIAGSAYGESSPVRVHSPLFYAEVRLEAGREMALPEAYDDRAAYVVSGSIEVDGMPHGPSRMVVFEPGSIARARAIEPSRVLVLGGARLDGERHIWWNFVSSSKARIESAKEAWREHRFAKVVGDETDFIPLPEG